jgi:hypothetical protein
MEQESMDRKNRDTGLALVLICLLTLLAEPRFWLIVTAIILLVVTMTRPQLFTPIARVWFGLTHFLGAVISSILLTLTFFLVVTPMAIIRRVAGADAMQMKQFRNSAASAFVKKERTYTPADLEKPY